MSERPPARNAFSAHLEIRGFRHHLYLLKAEGDLEKRPIYYLPRKCNIHLVIQPLRGDRPLNLRGKVHIKLTHHRGQACEEKLHFSTLELLLPLEQWTSDRRQYIVAPNHWRIKGNSIGIIQFLLLSDAVHYTYDRNCVNCFSLLSVSGNLNAEDVLHSCLIRIR